MKIRISDTSQQKIAKSAGLLFLLSLIVPLVNWALIYSKLIVPKNAIATVNNILNKEFLFRINIASELLISLIVIAMAVTLYAMLKSVNKNLALFALSLKLTEGILWAVIALGHAAALLVLKEQTIVGGHKPEQIQTLVGLFLDVHIFITATPGVFLGMNLVVFLYLLYKSNKVPRLLAGFGILSYGLIFIYDLSMILFPQYTEILIVQLVGWAPSILFELWIGLWLMIKGVNVQQQDIQAIESAKQVGHFEK